MIRACCWWDSRGRKGGSGPRGQMQPSSQQCRSYLAGHLTHEHSPGGPAATTYCSRAQTVSPLTIHIWHSGLPALSHRIDCGLQIPSQTRVHNTKDLTPIERIKRCSMNGIRKIFRSAIKWHKQIIYLFFFHISL